MADDRPVQLLITYRLREGMTIEEFRHWSREVDQPAVRQLPGIRRYEIFEVTGIEESGEGPDIVDLVEVDSWKDWLAVDSDSSMREIANDFFARICDEPSLQTLRVQRI